MGYAGLMQHFVLFDDCFLLIGLKPFHSIGRKLVLVFAAFHEILRLEEESEGRICPARVQLDTPNHVATKRRQTSITARRKQAASGSENDNRKG